MVEFSVKRRLPDRVPRRRSAPMVVYVDVSDDKGVDDDVKVDNFDVF